MSFITYLLLMFQTIVVSSIDCPKTIEWTKYHNSCLKLIVEAGKFNKTSIHVYLSWVFKTKQLTLSKRSFVETSIF